MTWTEGTWIISASVSIAGGYWGILTALFGLIIVLSFIVSVGLLIDWYMDTYF
jgi:hypothetical protein